MEKIKEKYNMEDIFEKIKNIGEEKKYIEVEKPLKKIGNSYFVQIPIEIAKENNFEKIKLKIEDKKAAELIDSFYKEFQQLKNLSSKNQESRTTPGI